MQLPEILSNHLDEVLTSELLGMQQTVARLRAAATGEALAHWEVTLAAIEIELWSRGYGPKPDKDVVPDTPNR